MNHENEIIASLVVLCNDWHGLIRRFWISKVYSSFSELTFLYENGKRMRALVDRVDAYFNVIRVR